MDALLVAFDQARGNCELGAVGAKMLWRQSDLASCGLISGLITWEL